MRSARIQSLQALGLSLAATAGCLPSVGRDDPSACHRAAETVAACTDQDAAAFLNACEAGISSADEVAALANFGCEDKSLVSTCVAGMLGARMWLAYKNGPGNSLHDHAAYPSLRDYFGEVVDEVTVVWNAMLLDDLVEVPLWVGAQTIGSRLYFDGDLFPYLDSSIQLETLAHELHHAAQAKSLGGVLPFAVAYCTGFVAAGMSYERNPFEVAADRVAADFLAH